MRSGPESFAGLGGWSVGRPVAAAARRAGAVGGVGQVLVVVDAFLLPPLRIIKKVRDLDATLEHSPTAHSRRNVQRYGR